MNYYIYKKNIYIYNFYYLIRRIFLSRDNIPLPWPLRLRRDVLAILCNITSCIIGNSYKWFANKKNTFLIIFFMIVLWRDNIPCIFSITLTFAPASRHLGNPYTSTICIVGNQLESGILARLAMDSLLNGI